ncbi:O-antigen translocase [Pseudomonas sp. So3.2b]|uniref:O-antigen translocase n=1 Tax=Pseudomonas sp. So3.2b TaxID=2864101 RepID=UPI001C68B883|nr:O-antigen translocase [Pseudomonas sp. So3.2b]QYM70709.1 O-antigen translocase [Pseudomonas sp. So3.2b]
MNLVKTSLLNGIAVAIKMITLLGLNKVLAIYVGPAGYAAIGQFQNALQVITIFTGGAITNGVVKYTAEYHEEPEQQIKLWKTAGFVAVVGSVAVALLIAVYSKELASLFLNNTDLSGVFLWFSCVVIFFSLNILLLAILNGRKEIVLYIVANIAGSFLSFGVTFYLATNFGLYGALVALVIYQSISFIVTLLLCLRTQWFKISYLFGCPDKQIAKKLFAFFLMAVVSAACAPLAQMLVRSHIGTEYGWEMAGYWEAMWRLSAAYLLLVTTTLSVYYLPKLSELKTANEVRAEIIQGYKLIFPVALLAAGTIYVLRDFVVAVLFTSDFYPVRNFFAGQVVGDSLKIFSWIMAYVMLSRAMVKVFIITEIIFSISLYLLTIVFTQWWGVESATWAYAVNYALYSLVMYIFVYLRLDNYFHNKLEHKA